MAIILFTLFYAGVTMGVDLNLHYCGGKLAKVTIALPSPTCCCDETKADSDCCADAQLSIQLDVDQVHMSVPNFDANDLAEQLIATDETTTTVFDETSEAVPQVLANPPPLRAQQLRILMGSLTYYG